MNGQQCCLDDIMRAIQTSQSQTTEFMKETRRDREKMMELIDMMSSKFQKNMDDLRQEQNQWRIEIEKRIASLGEPKQNFDPRVDSILAEFASMKQAIHDNSIKEPRSVYSSGISQTSTNYSLSQRSSENALKGKGGFREKDPSMLIFSGKEAIDKKQALDVVQKDA